MLRMPGDTHRHTAQSVLCGLGPGHEGVVTGAPRAKRRKCACLQTLIAVGTAMTSDMWPGDSSRWPGNRLVLVCQTPVVRCRWHTTCIVKSCTARPALRPWGAGNKNKLHHRRCEKHGSGAPIWTFSFPASVYTGTDAYACLHTWVEALSSRWKRNKASSFLCYTAGQMTS